nr:hypothetical protein [Blastococcus sp. TBT05-19]
MGEQGADGALPDVDAAVLAGLRLRLALDDLAADLDELRADVDHALLEVDVGPAERARLAAAQAGERQHLEEGAEAVAGGVVEEGAELGRFPRANVRGAVAGEGDVGGGVVGHQPGPTGGGERGAQHGVDAADRRHPAAGGAQVADQLLDVPRAEVAEPHVTDGGDDVQLDVAAVHQGGGGAEAVADAVLEPGGQEGADGLPAVVAVLAGVRGVQDGGERGVGLGLGDESALARFAAAAGLRVAADVGPVVPGAVTALLAEPRAGGEQLAGLVAATAAAERRALHDCPSSM